MAPEPSLSAKEGLKRGQLALSVYKSAGIELTAEDIDTFMEKVDARLRASRKK